MTRTQVKEKAQEYIMHSIAVTLHYVEDDASLSKQEKEIISEEVRKQANRVAKMFGYDRAWFD